jgi:hypothetical protein
MSRIASYDFRFGRKILQNKLLTTLLGRTMEMFLNLRSPSYSTVHIGHLALVLMASLENHFSKLSMTRI